MGNFRDTAEPDSGLFTDYTGVVTDAWYATNTRFGGMQLNLQQTTDSDDDKLQVFTEQINCGDAWESFDGGKTVEHKEGKRKFHANSRMSKFLVRLGDIGAFDDLDTKGLSTLDAESYVGLNLKWDEVSEPYRMQDRETKEWVSGVSRYNLPVEYLGMTSDVSASPSKPQEPNILDSLPSDLVDNLRTVRANSTDLDSFMNEAIQLTGVSGNGMLLAAIADPDGLYKSLAN